jgi:plasmid stability protein
MAPKKTTGRPASPFPHRYPVRVDDDMIAAMKIAAASCGLPVQDWARATLAAEAAKATHVPPIYRAKAGRRG